MIFQKNKKLLALALVLLGRGALVNGAANEWRGDNPKPNFEDTRVIDAADKIWQSVTAYRAELSASSGSADFAASTINWKDWAKNGEIYEAIATALVGIQRMKMTSGSGVEERTSFKELGAKVLKEIDHLAKAMLMVKSGKGSLTQLKSATDAALLNIQNKVGTGFVNPCVGIDESKMGALMGDKALNVPPCVEQWSLLKMINDAFTRTFSQGIVDMLNTMVHEATSVKMEDLKKTFDDSYMKRLFTPTAGQSVLTENLITDQEFTNFQTFLRDKFIPFIGADNKDREKDAKWLAEAFIKLATAMRSVFWKLGLAYGYAKEVRKKGNLTEAEVQQTKDKRLTDAKKLRTVDVREIPWSARNKEANIDQMFTPLTQQLNLPDMANRANKIVDNCAAGREKCWFKGCRDRFDLLAYMTAAFQALYDKVTGAMDMVKQNAEAVSTI